MKTLEEIVETILSNKRITKGEVKILYEKYQLECIRNNALEKDVKDLKEKVSFLKSNLRKLEDASNMYVGTCGIVYRP